MRIKTKGKRVFIGSDPHFGTESFYKFSQKHQHVLRPEFPDAATGDAAIVARHNAIVPATDSVFFMLGDLASSNKALETYLPQMNGETKVLIMGNHDLQLSRALLDAHFKYVLPMAFLKGETYILTHVPIHPSELRGKYNWHGHTHRSSISEPGYRSFCYEVNNYSPVEVTALVN